LTPGPGPDYGAVMLQEIERLLVLQDRDRRIRTLQTELKNAPLEQKALEKRLAEANAGADGAKQRLRELEVRKNLLQTEANGKREQIARFRTQQMQTRKNEEYQALASEIAHFEKEVQRIEDGELEAMEEIERMNPVVAEAEKAVAEAKSVVATQISDLQAKVKRVEESLTQVTAERAELARELDEDLLGLYDRLFATKNGDAVVPLENEVCAGCHMKLTTQTALRVRAENAITHCEQCGRILYLPR